MRIRSRIHATLYIIAITLLSGCGDDSRNPAKQLELARASQLEGETKTAVIHLKSALQTDPNSFEARYLLGKIYLDNGKWQEAEKELRSALESDSTHEEVIPLIAESLYQQAQFYQLLEETVARDDMKVEVRTDIHSYRTLAWVALDKIEEATLELAEAEKLAPKQTSALLAKAMLLIEEDNLEQAYESLQQVLKLEPQNAKAWSQVAGLELASGEKEKAEKAYGKAIESANYNVPDLRRRALVRMSQNDYEGAKADLEAAKSKAPNHPVTLYVEGLLEFHNEHYAEAQSALEKVVNFAPGYAQTDYYLGAAHYFQNNLEQAEQHLLSFLRDNPQSVEALRLLSAIYNKSGNPERTLELLEPHLKSDKGDTQLLALAGEAYFAQDELASAENVLQIMSDETPDSGAAHMMLGLAQLQAGEEAAAIKSLESAAELGFEYRTEIALGFYYLNTQQYDKALATAIKLEKLSPDNPAVHFLKGRIYIGNGDINAAQESLIQALALNPGFTVPALSLAAIDLQKNDIRSARGRYLAILENQEYNVAAMMGMAEAAQLENNDAEYIEWLEKAATANPSSVAPRVYLVQYYLEKGEPTKARTIAREAVMARPELPAALALLGKVEQLTKNKEEALTTYSKLVALVPESATAHYNLAKAYIALNDLPQARAALQKSLELNPTRLESIYALSSLEAISRNHEEALKMAKTYQIIAPDSVSGLTLEGDAMMAGQHHAEAASAYTRALEKQEDSGRIVAQLHVARLRLGEEKAADDEVLSWLKKHPDNSLVRRYLARSALKRGLDQEALEQYQVLTTLTPTDAMAFNNLAILYQRVQDPRALETAETAHRLLPEDHVIADTLGWILVERGEVEEGFKLIERAAAENPTNPEIQYHLAYCLAETGKSKEARRVITKIQGLRLNPALQSQINALKSRLDSA